MVERKILKYKRRRLRLMKKNVCLWQLLVAQSQQRMNETRKRTYIRFNEKMENDAEDNTSQRAGQETRLVVSSVSSEAGSNNNE